MTKELPFSKEQVKPLGFSNLKERGLKWRGVQEVCKVVNVMGEKAVITHRFFSSVKKLKSR